MLRGLRSKAKELQSHTHKQKLRGKVLPWPAIGANVVLQRRLHGLHNPVLFPVRCRPCIVSVVEARPCDTTARLPQLMSCGYQSSKKTCEQFANTGLVKKKACSLDRPVSRFIPTSYAWLRHATLAEWSPVGNAAQSDLSQTVVFQTLNSRNLKKAHSLSALCCAA